MTVGASDGEHRRVAAVLFAPANFTFEQHEHQFGRSAFAHHDLARLETKLMRSFDEPIKIGFGEIGEDGYFAKRGEKGRFVGWIARELQRAVEISRSRLAYRSFACHFQFGTTTVAVDRRTRLTEPWPDIDG